MMEDERIETIAHNVKELQQTHSLTFSLRCVSGYHTWKDERTLNCQVKYYLQISSYSICRSS